jgi:anti-anti-sigma regulatory factor
MPLSGGTLLSLTQIKQESPWLKEAPMHEDRATHPSLIRLSGAFDGLAARRLEQVLARAEPGERLRVDLTQVREFHDFGIAVLAQALTRCRAEVTLLGLRQHQVRVLRYFDIDTAPLERATTADAA